MISDDDLHRLAVFLGSCAMMMIVLYHFLDVNSKDDVDAPAPANKGKKVTAATAGSAAAASTEGEK